MLQLIIGSPPPTPAPPADTDTLLEWFVALTALAGALAWPIFLLAALWIFRVPIADIIPRIEKAGAGPVTVELGKSILAAKQATDSISREVSASEILSPEEKQSSRNPSAEHADLEQSAKSSTLTGADGLIKDPEFPEWTFYPINYSPDSERKEEFDKLNTEDPERARESDPQFDIMDYYDYAAYPAKLGWDSSAARLLATAWGQANIPKSIHDSLQSLRQAALAASKLSRKDVTSSEAKVFSESASNFRAALDPFIQAYNKSKER